ncbi:unnamed protein product [Camellia sinensis]
MVGLPSVESREMILRTLLGKEKVENLDFKELAAMTEGYSGSDLKQRIDLLGQNRMLINEINQNHESKVPDNLSRNVGLIRELNNNIRRVVDLYADLSSSFTKSMEASSEGDSSGLKSDGKAGHKRNRPGRFQANPDLVPSLLTLAMNDAMTYDKATKSGGPNGSVRFSVSEDVEEQRKESSLSATDNLVNEENAQLKDDETEAPDGTMVGDDLQNHNVSNAGNDTVGKYFCYDLPVSEETGVWIPVSVPPMSGSEHEEWNRGFSFGGGYFADGDMGWNQFVGEEKEMTMWDVVLDMLLVARGKVTALASGAINSLLI